MANLADLKKINIYKLSVSTFYDVRTRSSFCWKYFGNLVLCDLNKKSVLNPDHVYCAACLNNFKMENGNVTFGAVKVKNYNKSVSTGNLTRHLRDEHSIIDQRPCATEKRKIKKKEQSGQKQKRAREGTTSKLEVVLMNGEFLARDIALWFCNALLPFDSAFDEGMVDFFKKYGVPIDYSQKPSPSDISGPALSYIYDCMLCNVKELIAFDKPENYALTVDVWTDHRRQLNYITFGLRYITFDFKLNVLNLSTHRINENNTIDQTENLIHEVLAEFGLDNKIVHAVTDVGGVIRQAILRGNMTYHSCLGHALHNLIVEGLCSVPEVTMLVRKCKNIVKALRYRSGELEDDTVAVQQHFLGVIDIVAEMLEYDENDPLMQNNFPEFDSLEGFQEEHILPTVSKEANYIVPSQHTYTGIPTRWHCILEMLESLVSICNREQMNNNLQRVDKNELKLTQYEWRLIEDLVKFLKRFREVVEILTFSGSCSFNVALVFRTEIIDILNSMISNESMIFINMKHVMLANVDRKFPVTPSMVAAALLDSRFICLSVVDSYLAAQGMTKVAFLAAYVKDVIKGDNIFVENIKVEKDQLTDSLAAGPAPSSPPSILTKLSLKHSNNIPQNMSSDPVEQECWRYLATAVQPTDGNLLSHWNENRQNFPYLSALARCLLSIPATCTPSERVFSSAGLTFSAKRLRLNPATVNKVMFIHDNYVFCK